VQIRQTLKPEAGPTTAVAGNGWLRDWYLKLAELGVKREGAIEHWPMLTASALMLVVFILDLALPVGIAVPIVYLAPIMVSLWSHRDQHTLLLANVATALIVAGLLISPPSLEFKQGAVNRLLAIYGIWVTTIVCLHRRKEEISLREAHDRLEKNVREQTTELTKTNEEYKKEIADRKRAEESLRQLSGYLLQLQDDERRRIARELHDTTAQSLAAIAVNLARLEKLAPNQNPKVYDVLAETIAMAEQCSREIRTLSYLLHPPLLEEAGLGSAVKWYADGYSQRSGIKVDVEVPPQLERLPNDLETTLFRIVQESLTNISRHSESKTARIRIRREPGEIMLEVQDEGRGIPPEKLERVSGNISGLGVGIAGIWERVRQFEGDLDINSSNHGTTITVVLPIKEEVA
jgi:signal transduction histidine kinase